MSNNNNKSIFYVLILFFILFLAALNIIEQYFLVTNERTLTSLADNPDFERFKVYFESKPEISVLEIATFVASSIIGYYLIVFLFYASVKICDLQISFSALSKSLLIAHFAFLIALLIKISVFLFKTDFSIKDYNSYYPLSLMNLFQYGDVDKWLVTIFQAVNLFQIPFFLLLYFSLPALDKGSSNFKLLWSLSTYVAIVSLWLILATFFQLMFA